MPSPNLVSGEATQVLRVNQEPTAAPGATRSTTAPLSVSAASRTTVSRAHPFRSTLGRVRSLMGHIRLVDLRQRVPRSNLLGKADCETVTEYQPTWRGDSLMLFSLEGVEIVVFAYILVLFYDRYTSGSEQLLVLLGPQGD